MASVEFETPPSNYQVPAIVVAGTGNDLVADAGQAISI
jgi:hypothetical protein